MKPQDLKTAIQQTNADFLDFGCSEGGSIRVGQNLLGGTIGLGLDIDPNKVKKSQDKGYNALVADVTMLQQTPDVVRFVILRHFLEHLHGQVMARKCIASAVSAATDFVYIAQPWFDSDGYLARHGLKLYWSDWNAHPYHMTTLDMYLAISRIPAVRRWGIYARSRIYKSINEAVLPIEVPFGQHGYQSGRDRAKPTITFTEPVYYEVVALLQISEDFDFEAYREKLKITDVVMESDQITTMA